MFFRKVGPNTKGRDFIVGDLHGYYDRFMAALERVKFDPRVDRVFSVGDLIDRGPDSFRCLQLLCKPWFFSARGNHEQTFLNYLTSRGAAEDYLDGEGQWLGTLTQQQLSILQTEVLPRLVQLPFVLHVEDKRRPFNVIHAEASRAGAYWDDEDLQTVTPQMAQSLLWGRETLTADETETEMAWTRARVYGRIRVSPEPFLAGLSLTYAGHTVVPQPFLHRSHLFIDRGVFRGTRTSDLLVVDHAEVTKTLRDVRDVNSAWGDLAAA